MISNPFRSRRHPVQVELDDLARGAAGALLFGAPLLFTMEMWRFAAQAMASHLLLLVAIGAVVNVLLARMSGFRSEHAMLRHDIMQSCEALAIGTVLAAAVLAAIGVIDTSTSLGTALRMVAMLAVPLSIGASVGNAVFSPDRVDGGDDRDSPARELLRDVAATIAGALFIGITIAPTDEVPQIAAGIGLANALATIAVSLFAGYVIVFASGFDASHHSAHEGGWFQSPFGETMLAYWVSMLAAVALLAAFGHLTAEEPIRSMYAHVIVLALPASIGGAAGRIVV